MVNTRKMISAVQRIREGLNMNIRSPQFLCTVVLLGTTSLASTAFAGNPSIYEPSLLPANPQVGHCYARVLIPAQFSTTQQTVMTEDAYSHIEVKQPTLASRAEQVEIKEASVRFDVRQPSFRTVTEQRMVRPAYDKLSVSQPQFKTVRESIVSSAPRRVWKLGNPGALAARGYTIVSTADGGRNGQGYRSTTAYGAARNGAARCGSGCEIWCLVEEPAESVSFSRKIMVSPGAVRRTPVPAKYTSITKQIVADPGGVREIHVPAQYRSIQVQHIIDPGGSRQVNVPAKYGTVDKKSLIAGERYEWRRVVCDPAKGRASSHSRSTSPYSSHVTGGQYSSSLNTGVSHHNSGHVNSGVQTISSPPTGTYYYGTNKPVHRSGHISTAKKINNLYRRH